MGARERSRGVREGVGARRSDDEREGGVRESEKIGEEREQE